MSGGNPQPYVCIDASDGKYRVVLRFELADVSEKRKGGVESIWKKAETRKGPLSGRVFQS